MRRYHLPIAFVDTETSGLDPSKGAQLLEVAAVVWNSAGFTSYSTLVKPQHDEFEWAAMDAHHLRPVDLSYAPAQPDVVTELLAFLKRHRITHLVAHNAGFDCKFLPELRGFTWLDTLKLTRRAWQEAPSHKNFSLFHGLGLNRFWVGAGASHRALTDVLATSELFDAALDKLGVRDDATIEELTRLHDQPFKVRVMWYWWKLRGKSIADIDTHDLRYALKAFTDMDQDSRRSIIGELSRRSTLHGFPAHLAG